MIVNILYLGIGILVGILVKYELEQRQTKKRIAKKVSYLRATASSTHMQDCDDVLQSLRHMNQSLKQIKP